MVLYIDIQAELEGKAEVGETFWKKNDVSYNTRYIWRLKRQENSRGGSGELGGWDRSHCFSFI